ncbi:MAG TPA: hypothetical protein VK809_09125, partial [Bacteroidia bacterium]|nr:hypothetical protein [Bacteroidia bacterium]
DAYIIKLDSLGNVTWIKTVGGKNSDFVGRIVQTKDGGYVAAGYTTSFGDTVNGDVYIFKLSSSGNLVWTRTVGGTGIDDALSLTKSNDGGFAFAGITWSFGNASGGYYYIGKLDSTGTVEWTRTIGGTQYNWANSIISLKDGGYAVAGTSNSYSSTSTMFLAELDSAGNTCTFDSTGGAIGSGGVVGTGGIIGSGGIVDSGGLIDSGGKANIVCSETTGINEIEIATNEITVYPNPASTEVTFKISPVKTDILKWKKLPEGK